MIKFSCPHCGKSITAPDDFAGKKGKCPGCKSVVVIEDPDLITDVDVIAEDEVEVVEAEEAPPAKKSPPRAGKPTSAIREGAGAGGKARRAVVADDEDDAPEAEEVDDDEEDDRPRRKKKKKGRRWRGEWADCPNCGAPGDATRLYYTWWGGFVGPLIISHVRCNQCGTAYNGKTGNYNTTAIILWVVLPAVLIIGAFIFFGAMGALANL